jgi:hypothetical protein
MKSKIVFLFVILVFAVSSAVASCPVCYGETDVHTASAVNAAIYSLLIVTGVVLSFFVSLILHVRRRLTSTNNTNNIE